MQIVILSYQLRENKVKLNYLFDKNKYLQYNVNKLDSPSYLFTKLNPDGKKREFELSRNFRVKRVNIPSSDKKAFPKVTDIKTKVSLLSILLGLGSRAEAETSGSSN